MNAEHIVFTDSGTTYHHESGAEIDPTGRYRYRLWRQWAPGDQTVGFVMLNPSTADALTDDPTIRRCIRFAQSWGYVRLEVGNLFAWRATDPVALAGLRDPVGPENDRALRELADRCDVVVAAWGNRDRLFIRQRAREVEESFGRWRNDRRALYALAVLKSGRPQHPLYLSAKLRPRLLAELRSAVIP